MKCKGEMLHFDVGKHLGKCVSEHVVSRTINEINGTIIDNKLNKMLPNVSVFCASVLRPVVGEHNGGL
jgi:hypothetical protein